jgi:hypothetical protein
LLPRELAALVLQTQRWCADSHCVWKNVCVCSSYAPVACWRCGRVVDVRQVWQVWAARGADAVLDEHAAHERTGAAAAHWAGAVLAQPSGCRRAVWQRCETASLAGMCASPLIMMLHASNHAMVMPCMSLVQDPCARAIS